MIFDRRMGLFQIGGLLNQLLNKKGLVPVSLRAERRSSLKVPVRDYYSVTSCGGNSALVSALRLTFCRIAGACA